MLQTEKNINNKCTMERNHVIDLLKFTCAILVVFLHTKSAYHDALTPITRCAVPCFFYDIWLPVV